MERTIECVERDKCTGCGACMQRCPKGCIHLVSDTEGFLVPSIDSNVCIKCGYCASVCPQLQENQMNFPVTCYGAKHRGEEILLESSSGGMFSLFAEEIIQRGGCVFGCAFVVDAQGYLKAEHIGTEELDNLKLMRGSKYVQSDTGYTYRETKERLERGQWVLYTGTPCEIAGLKSYLSKEYERLITIDLICHGVPSPVLFKRYLEYCSESVNGDIIAYKFRDKSKGCGMYYYYYYRERGTGKIKAKQGARDRNGYFTAFSHGSTYRESCYQCAYAQTKRVGDITIGDYFAIDFQYPEFDAKKGVSALMINTEKGKDIFEAVHKKANFVQVHIEEITEHSSNMKRPSRRPDVRNYAYDNINKSAKEIFEQYPYIVTTKAKIIACVKENIPDSLVRKIRSLVFKKNARIKNSE